MKSIVDSSLSSSNAEAIIVGLDDLSEINLSQKPLAIAIGYRESILNKFGYGIFDDELIFEDILYDNKHFDADSMCLDRFKSIASTRLLPVFKYVKLSSANIPDNSLLAKYISMHNSIEKIITNNTIKSLKNVPNISEYDDLIICIEERENVHKKSGVLLKNIHNFSLTQVRDACKIIFEFDKSTIKGSTHFKRCIMYLDLLENYKQEKSQ